MPVSVMRATPISLPTRAEIDLMSAKQLVQLLRRTPDPDTGKKAHSLSHIARIAKSSPSWPAATLALTGKKSNMKGSAFSAPLRRHLHKLLEERGHVVQSLSDTVPVEAPRRRPAPPRHNPEFEKFLLAFESHRTRLLNEAVEIDELAKAAPAVFRPAFAAVRETLLGLGEQLAIPAADSPAPQQQLQA